MHTPRPCGQKSQLDSIVIKSLPVSALKMFECETEISRDRTGGRGGGLRERESLSLIDVAFITP